MGVKILFFSRGTLGKNSMFPEKGGQNSIFFPSALKFPEYLTFGEMLKLYIKTGLIYRNEKVLRNLKETWLMPAVVSD